MRKILHLFKRDLSNIKQSVIGLIVVVGLVIIPCLYAWFNIAGSWDPYGNTGNLKVAVANSDAGYQSDLVPVELNMGDSVVNSLRANDSLDWVFVDEEKAVEGVKSGAYYAAVVIPEDFSADMMTLFSSNVEHAQIVYYENQKANAIAPRVTDKGASTVRQQIDETFTETISDVGLAVTSSLLDYMDSDDVTNYVANLSSTLGDGISSLRNAASNTGSYAELLGSTCSLISSTGSLLEETGTTSDDAKNLLADAKSGLADVEGALGDASAAVSSALVEGSASFDDVSESVDEAFAAGTTHADDTAGQLTAIADKLDAQVAANKRVLESIKEYYPDLTVLQTMQEAIIAKEEALAEEVRGAAEDLASGSASAKESKAQIKAAISEAKQGFAQVKSDYEGTLSDDIKELESTTSGIASSASGISSSLDKTVSGLASASSSLASDLQSVNGVLADASTALSTSADSLQKLKDELDAAVQSGDLDRIRSLIGEDPEALASALAAPVGLDKHSVYHIENYGSAMAPFYTAVSLWVGGIVLAAMMKVAVNDDLVRELAPVRLHHLYLGRFCLFGLLSLCQSTLMLLGELLFFGIQCENPLLYLLAGWVGGLMFCLFIYTLTVSFGDIGKALAVVLLVMQVGGSGGTFPIEMTADFFQAVYPFLPAAHLINAMHAAMAGGWGMEYWIELGTVMLYFIPILALGLLFRRPVIRANNWIIEKLEETKLM